MYGRCCDLEYCRVDSVRLNTANGRIWPPSEVTYSRWQHMHHIDRLGRQQRERGCFWRAMTPGRPYAGNQSHPHPADPAALEGTMAGIR